jgi:hypothetical protein
MSETPTWSLIEALDTLFTADVSLAAVITDIYKSVAGRQGERRTRPYLVIADTFDEDQHQFGALGNTTQYIHICVGNDGKTLHDIYNHIKRILRRPIAVTDHTMVTITVALEATFADDNFEGDRGIVRCAVTTVQA